MRGNEARLSAFAALRTRVLLVLAGFMVLLALAGWFAFNHIVEQTALRVGALVAERQVQYDRYRGLETLRREVALAKTLARAPNIIAWAKDEYDPTARERGIAELEHYRAAFDDESAFLVVDESGNYYFNDSQNSYADDPFQYTVRSDNPRDGWYFTTRSRREGCYLNVDHDDVLGVTKVWINCIVSHEGQVLGIVGTGLDLSEFIRDVVDIPQPGIQSMFVDASGAVQAHRDASMVDFHSLTKDIAQKNMVFSLFDTPSDMAALRAMMAATADPEDGPSVQTAYLSIDGKPMLVGVGYLGEIGWYNVTVMDVDTIVDKRLFLPIGVLLAALMGVAALAMAYIFKAMVLDRLERVEAGLTAVRDGKRVQFSPDPRNDEIGRLSRALADMCNAVTDSEIGLERQIKERTEELESLVNRDALTGILNRRGFGQAFEIMRARAYGDSWTYGVLLVDIDHFKPVNDTEGHLVGDQVIVEVARRLSSAVRRTDICARWGGDEFLIVIGNCDAERLDKIAAAIIEMMRSVPVALDDGRHVDVTVSIGTAIIKPDDTIDSATAMADAALYQAKAQGRDCAVAFSADLAAAG
ncbi:diguanylate cyclase [Pelagibacterium halotolerans]|uniref:sensor domain-containing diguanylate cyclase n=1 Tax=Pelagibacterium halotolerans TaxID=531813 RepID=UPI00384DAF94